MTAQHLSEAELDELADRVVLRLEQRSIPDTISQKWTNRLAATLERIYREGNANLDVVGNQPDA